MHLILEKVPNITWHLSNTDVKLEKKSWTIENICDVKSQHLKFTANNRNM